jgi:hypothetical protein
MAPSGGNSQPWQFKIGQDSISLYALPEKDHALLNFRNRGTWFAHGALLENLLIAASALGYRADYSIFPDSAQPTLTARVDLSKTDPHDEPLARAIPIRATNRKPYKTEPLTQSQLQAIQAAATTIPGVTLSITEDTNDLKKLGDAVSMNEVVMLENKMLHALFVKEIAWTSEEAAIRKGGLQLNTMELAPPQRLVLKNLLRHGKIMSLFNRIGMARTIAKDNAKVYSSAAAMGILTIEDTDQAFFAAGRCAERIWLTATNMELSMHLITGIFFMHQRILDNGFPEISQKHRNIISQAYKTVSSTFQTKQTIAILFRIGVGDAPSAISAKQPPTFLA